MTTTDSNKLLAFIKNNFPTSRFSKEKLSELSKILIGKIVYQMELSVNSWRLNETFTHHTITMKGDDLFPKGNSYGYITQEIKTDFENLKKIGKIYSFVIGSRKFTIYLIQPVYPSMRINHTRLISMFDKMVEQMYTWLFIASTFAESNCSPNLSIYVYLTNHKKNLAAAMINSREPILKIHVNTAFTMACPQAQENEIYIYRKEEWFKAFIHETFHSLGLDFANLPESIANNAIFSIFPVKCDLRFYEAYSETWAEIINVIFSCANKYRHTDDYMRSGRYNIQKLCKMVDVTLHTEKIFSLFQCVKILQHYKLEYNDLYDKTEESIQKRDRRYNERTNVFSYYILKSIMMFFYNDFIEWCVIHNAGSISFKKTLKNTVQFVGFIKQKYNDVNFLKAIKLMENWFSNHNHRLPIERKAEA